jgi:hypothetical protein
MQGRLQGTILQETELKEPVDASRLSMTLVKYRVLFGEQSWLRLVGQEDARREAGHAMHVNQAQNYIPVAVSWK